MSLIHTPQGWVVGCEACNGSGEVGEWREFVTSTDCDECDGAGTWDADISHFDNDELSLDGRFVSTHVENGKLIAYDEDGERIGEVDFERLRPLAECVA